MRTFRVQVPCHPGRLHETLESSGMRVATVRADWADLRDPVALWAVIVFQTGYDPDKSTLDGLIQTHLNDPSVKGKMPSAIPGVPPDKERSLLVLERV